MSKIKIESDGTPEGTDIYLNGEKQEGVVSISVELDGNKPASFPSLKVSVRPQDNKNTFTVMNSVVNCAGSPLKIEIG